MDRREPRAAAYEALQKKKEIARKGGTLRSVSCVILVQV